MQVHTQSVALVLTIYFPASVTFLNLIFMLFSGMTCLNTAEGTFYLNYVFQNFVYIFVCIFVCFKFNKNYARCFVLADARFPFTTSSHQLTS